VNHVITCAAGYGAKIHGGRYCQAQLNTFDYVWSKAESPSQLFRSINLNREISIHVAIKAGHMALVKRIVESCPVEGHLKELLVAIGLQYAIVNGRHKMFDYFLEEGAQPLHPILNPDETKELQYQDYVLCGPWTVGLVHSQRKSNSLHLCAVAGDLTEAFGQAMLEAILPSSRWDERPESLRRQNRVNCNCHKEVVEDPIVDCRNEHDETPFFLALKQKNTDWPGDFIKQAPIKTRSPDTDFCVNPVPFKATSPYRETPFCSMPSTGFQLSEPSISSSMTAGVVRS
jgi:hypothetical protein